MASACQLGGLCAPGATLPVGPGSLAPSQGSEVSRPCSCGSCHVEVSGDQGLPLLGLRAASPLWAPLSHVDSARRLRPQDEEAKWSPLTPPVWKPELASPHRPSPCPSLPLSSLPLSLWLVQSSSSCLPIRLPCGVVLGLKAEPYPSLGPDTPAGIPPRGWGSQRPAAPSGQVGRTTFPASALRPETGTWTRAASSPSSHLGVPALGAQ